MKGASPNPLLQTPLPSRVHLQLPQSFWLLRSRAVLTCSWNCFRCSANASASSLTLPLAACEFEEDKEKEDEVDFNFTLAPPRSSGECFARSHLLEKEGDFGSIVASNGAVGGEEVNSRRGMDTTPLIEPDRA
ncbi:hypothetical protein MRB53_036771 [Persea americana]|nr:hypothetical protein MRB53_036771 [Persea americana]